MEFARSITAAVYIDREKRVLLHILFTGCPQWGSTLPLRKFSRHAFWLHPLLAPPV